MTEVTSFSLPAELGTLTQGLTSVFRSKGLTDGQVKVIARQPNEYASGSPSEIVTCRLADGSQLQLLCKYQAEDWGSWSDVAYEAEVYRHILQPLQAGTPAFYGAHTETESGRTWLILEYIGEASSLNELADPAAVVQAASWLGRFHAAGEMLLGEMPEAFLKVYDADYYLRYARQALQSISSRHQHYPWLLALYRRFEELAGELFASQPTVVHGDFHLSNVLFRDGAIYPVDWEVAGVSAGELDLASLTEGWPEVEEKCELEYQRARWPEGAPVNFARRIGVARLACYFYKLGSRQDGIADRDSVWELEALRAVGERLALI
jgi:aminoglycoside phosphotransferase (APT) family kinase protein